MRAAIFAEDADNFIMIVYPGDIKYLEEEDMPNDVRQRSIRIPVKICPHLVHCKEICPLRKLCEGGFDNFCDVLQGNFRGTPVYFDISEEDYNLLFKLIEKMLFFPFYGSLIKKKRKFKRRKEK